MVEVKFESADCLNRMREIKQFNGTQSRILLDD